MYGGRENEDPSAALFHQNVVLPSEVKLVLRYKVKKLWLQGKELAFTCNSFQVKPTLDKHLILGHTIYKQRNSFTAKRGFSMNNDLYTLNFGWYLSVLFLISHLLFPFPSLSYTPCSRPTAELTCLHFLSHPL